MPDNKLEAKGFFAGLFDFHFTTFITLKFLRIIYAIMVALILLSGVGFFIALVSQGGASVAVGIIGVPLVTLLDLIFARIFMELIALFFRIGENTSIIASASGGAGPADGMPGPTAPAPAGF